MAVRPLRPARSAALLLIALVAALGAGVCGLRARPSHPEVLIVVNGASPVSVAIGSYYRQKRNVPASNVVTLNVPLADPNLGNSVQERITTQAAFDSQIRLPIENFLVANNLVDTIRIIVIASGVPHRLDFQSCPLNVTYLRDCPRATVDAELAVLFSNLVSAGGLGANGEALNPYFDSSVPFADWRVANPGAPLRYLVARLAGYQTPVHAGSGVPEDIKRIIDDAQASSFGGTVLIDEDPSMSSIRLVGSELAKTRAPSSRRSSTNSRCWPI
jgi:uncharacterized protein (TIGR03790 family)